RQPRRAARGGELERPRGARALPRPGGLLATRALGSAAATGPASAFGPPRRGLPPTSVPVLRSAPGSHGSALRREPGEGQLTRVAGGVTEGFLDAQQLVVLRDPLAARRSTGLDLPAAGGHGQVGDRGVLGLAGAVA